jgi:cytoskeleton protein RodZ
MTDSQSEQVRGPEGSGEPSGLGRALKRARVAQGYEISEVARTLRIRPEYLEALEEGDHGRLPGRVYAIGFVRTYSGFLNLDSAVAIERFKAEAVSLDHAHLLPPTPPPEGRVPGGALLFVSLVGTVVLYGAWWVMSADERRLPEIVAEVPGRLQQLVDAVAQASEAVIVRLPRGEAAAGPGIASAALPSVQAVPTVPQSMAQPASPAPVASLPDARPADDAESAEALDDDEGSRPAPESTTQVASSPAAPAPVVAALPTTSAPAASPALSAQGDAGVSRILLRAREENWVQVRDGTNAPVMTRVLKPGDTLKVPDRSGLTLMTGNAGGLDILVDGEAVPSLGALGQVRRNVALDADKLKAGTAIGRP